MKHPLVKKLEEKLLPEFEKVAEKIRQKIPNIMVTVNGYTVGSATQYQGYGFCIDCTLTDASNDETDNVALTVNLGHLTTTPKIDAGVGWGHPSGESEACFRDWGGLFPSESSMKVSDESLEDLYKDLPRLYEALFKALKRRKPADE
ncbi:MAG: hypothetical protein ACR2J3_13830 [Aridibacter sp.]